MPSTSKAQPNDFCVSRAKIWMIFAEIEYSFNSVCSSAISLRWPDFGGGGGGGGGSGGGRISGDGSGSGRSVCTYMCIVFVVVVGVVGASVVF